MAKKRGRKTRKTRRVHVAAHHVKAHWRKT